ncbi:MAG: putative transposase [Firmicutes bacterium ADurb.Bin080]|nr:MAG: putative transposase [Firmicutes bacterium ADurb.Bin080]
MTSQIKETITIAHKIQLAPNNKAITYFRKAFGCARFAYNWGLSKWKENYDKGLKKNVLEIKKEFNALKKDQFPFVYDVSKYVVQQPFINLDLAVKKYFRDLKSKKSSYPQYKKKSSSKDSFYIGGNVVTITDKRYIKIPKLGKVKMLEELRFSGKIKGITVSKKNDKYYVSIQMEITKEEYEKTHRVNKNKVMVGIDLGIKALATLSCGLQIENLKPLEKLYRKLIVRQRQLDKKQHAKTKQDVINGVCLSKNYIKHSLKLARIHEKISNIRSDYSNKLTTVLVNNFSYIGLEDLSVVDMLKSSQYSRSISDVSLSNIKRKILYKATYQGKEVSLVDRFYPSSKTCSKCGKVKQNLTILDRTFFCNDCGYSIDRDLNASINILNALKRKLGEVLPKETPVDLTALLNDFEINHIATSKVEAGIQHKLG